MSKAKRNKKKRNKKNYSGINDHKLRDKKLIPPFANIPKMQLVSWMNDRMPEMLWAALLLSKLGRVKALRIFREIIKYFDDLEEKKIWPDITHTGLSLMVPEHRDNILKIITKTNEQKRALQPLMLYDLLPLRNNWKEHINYKDTTIDEKLLFSAVSNVLDHQSQNSTDCRWLKIACETVCGFLKLPDIETVKEILYYPNLGDQRKVRPTIRSLEGMNLDYNPLPKTNKWVKDFWESNLKNTQCFALNKNRSEKKRYTIQEEKLLELYSKLIEHFFNTLLTTKINPKHDTIFGTVLYSISILVELIYSKIQILEQLALRTILECYITLEYLDKKNNDELWQSHRVFGAGQAKLAFLKLDELIKKPEYVDLDYLKLIANEDMWQEYLTINLGHWEKSNLRKMSEFAEVKGSYDKYYNWTSSYVHGHWGAVRDSIFETCGNPLHRFHRIPIIRPNLNSVLPDVVELFNKMLDVMERNYAGFDSRLELDNVA